MGTDGPVGAGNLRYNDATGEFEFVGPGGPRPHPRRRPMRFPPPPPGPSPREAAAAREAQLRRERHRRTVFIRLLCAMLAVDVLAILFSGGTDVLVAVGGVFFFLWFCYRLVTGARWPWIVLAGAGLAGCLR